MSRLVTAVVCAAFDAATDDAVLAARDLVARSGIVLTARPRHRPHLTLSAVRVHRAQLAGVVDLARAVAGRASPIRFTLGRVGTFRRAGALWLGPDDADDLRTLQRSVHAAVAAGPWPAAFAGRSRPAEWVPHCSLVTRLDPAALVGAETSLRRALTPIAATVTGLAVILVGGSGDVGSAPFDRDASS